MIRHKAEAMDTADELLHGVLEDKVKAIAVVVFKKHGVAGVAAKDNMVDGAGIMYAIDGPYQRMAER